MSDQYMIWSVEHGAWWGSGGCGYTQHMSQAGHYTRQKAIDICTRAIPGTSTDLGALPELPIRCADLTEMVDRYCDEYGNRSEPWK